MCGENLKSQWRFDILVLEIIFSSAVFPHELMNAISVTVAVKLHSLLAFFLLWVIYKGMGSTVDTLHNKYFVHNGYIKIIICNRVFLELWSVCCAV